MPFHKHYLVRDTINSFVRSEDYLPRTDYPTRRPAVGDRQNKQTKHRYPGCLAHVVSGADMERGGGYLFCDQLSGYTSVYRRALRTTYERCTNTIFEKVASTRTVVVFSFFPSFVDSHYVCVERLLP